MPAYSYTVTLFDAEAGPAGQPADGDRVPTSRSPWSWTASSPDSPPPTRTAWTRCRTRMRERTADLGLRTRGSSEDWTDSAALDRRVGRRRPGRHGLRQQPAPGTPTDEVSGLAHPADVPAHPRRRRDAHPVVAAGRRRRTPGCGTAPRPRRGPGRDADPPGCGRRHPAGRGRDHVRVLREGRAPRRLPRGRHARACARRPRSASRSSRCPRSGTASTGREAGGALRRQEGPGRRARRARTADRPPTPPRNPLSAGARRPTLVVHGKGGGPRDDFFTDT